MNYPKTATKIRGGFLKMAKANKKYRDSLIRHIFNEPEKALQFWRSALQRKLAASSKTGVFYALQREKELENR
jgi:hypothetical protein